MNKADHYDVLRTDGHLATASSALCIASSGVARNLNGGVYVLTSHCNIKTCVNVPHVNKTVTDFGGIYTDIPPVAIRSWSQRLGEGAVNSMYTSHLFSVIK